MSEDNAAPAEEQATEQSPVKSEDVADDTNNENVSIDDLKAEVEKWKTFSRKNESLAKKNSAAAEKLAEIEQAEMSESERLAAKVEALESELRASELTVLRSSVAAEKGLEPALAEVLQGDTAEELAESADNILAAISRKYAPKAALSSQETGAGVKGQAEPLDAESLAKAVFDRTRRR